MKYFFGILVIFVSSNVLADVDITEYQCVGRPCKVECLMQNGNLESYYGSGKLVRRLLDNGMSDYSFELTNGRNPKVFTVSQNMVCKVFGVRIIKSNIEVNNGR